MIRRNRSIHSLVLLVIGALATSAVAQPASTPKKQPTQHELAQARAHFKNAEAAKAQGNYETAAAEYLAAYELFEDPEFFFDVGEVYRLAGDEPHALTYYEKYLELDPNGRGAATAHAAAAELRRSIAAKEDAANRAAEEEAKRKAAADAKRKLEDAANRAAEEEAKRKAAALSGRGLRRAGIATGGAGLVALGVGVMFGLHARSISDETAGWDTFDPARFDQGKAAERNMFILTGVGVAALVTGGVLYYLGRRAGATAESSARSAVTFTPAIGPGEVTFTAVGRF